MCSSPSPPPPEAPPPPPTARDAQIEAVETAKQEAVKTRKKGYLGTITGAEEGDGNVATATLGGR